MVRIYLVDPTGNYLLRSVSGRPLDFVVNVTNKLPDGPNYVMRARRRCLYNSLIQLELDLSLVLKHLTTIHYLSLLSNANFSVAKNMSQTAPRVFNEYTFTRTFLFNANCMSDRAIIDTLGDTRFIDLTGIRSFNAISSNSK
jgi:hypothetical protein